MPDLPRAVDVLEHERFAFNQIERLARRVRLENEPRRLRTVSKRWRGTKRGSAPAATTTTCLRHRVDPSVVDHDGPQVDAAAAAAAALYITDASGSNDQRPR
jgi:hypothetical protein